MGLPLERSMVTLFLVKHLLDTSLMVYLLHLFFPYRWSRGWMRHGLVVVVAIFLTALYVLGQALLVIIGVLCCSALLCQLVFAGERRQLLSMTMLLCVVRILLEFIPFGLFALLWQKPPHLLGETYPERLWLVACSVCLSYFLGWLLIRWHKRSPEGLRRYLSSNLIYTLIPLVNVGVLSYLIYLNAFLDQEGVFWNLLFFLMTMGITLSTLVTFFAHATDHQRLQLAYRLQQEALQTRHTNQLYDLQQQNLSQIRKITHDFHNHLLVLSQLTQEDAAVTSYRTKLEQDVQTVRSLLPQGIQNKTLQVILYHYQNTCKTQNIALELDLRYDDFSFLASYDLSGILFNALDNAVHATLQATRPWISLRIKKTGSMVLLSVENSCTDQALPAQQKGHPREDAPGYGCGNILDLVHKNGGQLSTTHQDGRYRLMILLPEGDSLHE